MSSRHDEWQHPHRNPVGDWHTHAACYGNTQTMYGIDDRASRNDRAAGYHTPAEARAVAICNTCPVKTECLQHAIDNDERWGVWGGTTPRERWDQRKKHAIGGRGCATYIPNHWLQRLCSDKCRQAVRKTNKERYYQKKRGQP